MEVMINLSSARSLRTIDASEWLGSGAAHFLEWDHRHEQSRPLNDIVQFWKSEHWPRFIKPGCTCIDIGAHAGDTALPMGLFAFDKHRSRPGKIVAVEPNPSLHELLTATLTINSHIADFRLERCAITAQDVSEVELADHGNENCNGGIIGSYSVELTDRLKSAAATTYKTKGRSLNSVIESHLSVGCQFDLQFVKIDCEGYDKEILRSAKNVLEQIKPVIYAEWFAWFTEEDDADFFAAIKEIGYQALHPKALRPLLPGERTFDVTCIHQSRLQEFI